MMDRFKIDNDIGLKENKIETYPISTIVDNEHKTFYFIIDDVDNVKLFVDRLNFLHDENNRLKKELRGNYLRIRERTLEEVKKEIEKLERYE